MFSPPRTAPRPNTLARRPYAATRTKINLTRLRRMTPRQPVAFSRSLRVARNQADLLLQHAAQSNTGPINAIARTPKVRVDYVVGQRLHGASFWDTHARQWVIQINQDSHWKQQLFAIAHEFKYVLDYRHNDLLYQGSPTRSAICEAHCAASYFARYLLVPDDPLIDAVSSGTTDADDLADRFGVTEDVICERLQDLQLSIEPGARPLVARGSCE
ncbi:ImmA/IrrE family metallo-endopeptidase [Nocardia sp. NPDC051911]|uniref:ImmA/IrrE family metallo-endopeptidase n=1 Tax=Nocardia sp. NPDC051911 TaxID=3154648 RepID=UPI00341D8FE3